MDYIGVVLDERVRTQTTEIQMNMYTQRKEAIKNTLVNGAIRRLNELVSMSDLVKWGREDDHWDGIVSDAQMIIKDLLMDGLCEEDVLDQIDLVSDMEKRITEATIWAEQSGRGMERCLLIQASGHLYEATKNLKDIAFVI